MKSARQIITVTGYKGGVAKSTTAIHLADYLSDYGPTLIVDCDQNRTALSRYKKKSRVTS
ncbi:MAG: ParA family protein [Waterburya sp.]